MCPKFSLRSSIEEALTCLRFRTTGSALLEDLQGRLPEGRARVHRRGGRQKSGGGQGRARARPLGGESSGDEALPGLGQFM